MTEVDGLIEKLRRMGAHNDCGDAEHIVVEAALALSRLQRELQEQQRVVEGLKEIRSEIHRILQDETITDEQKTSMIFGLVVPCAPITDIDMGWAKSAIAAIKEKPEFSVETNDARTETVIPDNNAEQITNNVSTAAIKEKP